LLVEAPLSPILYDRCQVDFLFLDDPAALQRPPPDTDRTALLSTYWLGVNADRTPLPLRKAIAHAIDREALVQGLWPHVRLATRYLPPEMPGAPVHDEPAFASYPAFDPEKARALVQQGAYDGTELTLLVRGTRTFLPERAIADGVRRQLETVGLKVRVVETSNFASDVQGPDGRVRHALFLKRVGADYAHPQTLFTPFQAGGINYTGFASIDGGRELAAFQALLDEGAAAPDPEAARATWARAEALLVGKNAVVVPLLHPERYFRRRAWVGGLGVDPFNFLTLASLHVAPSAAGSAP
jgi:peptide/nickel transport system substrate-binding protein